MTGADVKAIRDTLGKFLGRRISCRDLGLALGLAPANAADTVRSWEDGSKDVSGPARVALRLMVRARHEPSVNFQTRFNEAVHGLFDRQG